MDKLKNLLNKDVKEFNVKLLVIAGIIFISIMGLISYKLTNSSYALFTDEIIGSKTITLHYEEAKTVTFDPDGGIIPAGTDWTGSGNSATKDVTLGLTYGELPEPTKEGYTFKGWNGKNLFNPDTMIISNTAHTQGSEEIVLYAGVYDRILPVNSWIPKPNTTYTMIIKILENTFDQPIEFNTDNRFYIEQYNNDSITAGEVYDHVSTFTTKTDFSNVTLGSFWFWTTNTVTGNFKVKLAG